MTIAASAALGAASGLFAIPHCIGMCGPLALALGMNHTRMSANLSRQLIFSVGRILTYGFGGAAAAFAVPLVRWRREGRLLRLLEEVTGRDADQQQDSADDR